MDGIFLYTAKNGFQCVDIFFIINVMLCRNNYVLVDAEIWQEKEVIV